MVLLAHLQFSSLGSRCKASACLRASIAPARCPGTAGGSLVSRADLEDLEEMGTWCELRVTSQGEALAT